MDYIAQHSPFIYRGEHKDRLFCVSTGIVAPAMANADRAVELGEVATSALTGKTYADAKLKRNDKVVSIRVASNSAKVQGCEVEVDPISLFLRVTCVIRNHTEMKDHLSYEFSKQPPSLFEGPSMRKTAKSFLADALKASVSPLRADEIQKALYVIDGCHLLHSLV